MRPMKRIPPGRLRGVLLVILLPAGCGMDLQHFNPGEDLSDGQAETIQEDSLVDVRTDPAGDEAPPDPVEIPPTCGDGTVQDGEECDDGNGDESDGCTSACLFSCHLQADCSDDDECTEDVCLVGGTGRVCANEVRSGFPCEDGNPCTGGDQCNAEGECVGLFEVECNDFNDCTVDRCDPAAGGCVFESLPIWFRDEDGDGYGYEYDAVCAASQPDGYIAGGGDCCDKDGDVSPAQDGFFTRPYTCGDSSVTSFDYNCDGAEEPRWGSHGY
jgi:cysteine-rich repeat protein